jgi:hypothetical protein
MGLKDNLEELERLKNKAMKDLPPNMKKELLISVDRMSKTTSLEDLKKVENEELERLKNVC